MKKVIASLVFGLVASVSFAAAPVAPVAAPVVKAEEVKPAVKDPVKKEVAKTKHKAHKAHKAAKHAVKASTPVAPATK